MINYKSIEGALTIIALSILLFSCSGEKKKMVAPEAIVLIETSLGDIKVKLYNETPLHRDNFLKLVKEGFYDSILFHRVINNFMIQGGDPTTKKPRADAEYGEADTGYTLPSEFVDDLFHKKGALAAAREGDAANPKKKSSGSQFYIVQGKVFTEEQLAGLANSKNLKLKNALANEIIKNEANRLIFMGQSPNLTELAEQLKDTIDLVFSSQKLYSFGAPQIHTYTTLGGAPHLDGDYTVFGEVIDGQEVVDKIAGSQTNRADRPVNNISMKLIILNHSSE